MNINEEEQSELRKLYKKYDIPPKLEDGVNEVEILKSRKSKLYDLIMNENKKIAKLHEPYELYIHSGLYLEYSGNRKWDITMAIREILQNALDEQEEAEGISSINKIKVTTKYGGISISDKGRGIKPEYFGMGRSDKKCWQRGRFGEGFKLASIYLLNRGFDVYILSKDNIYRFVKREDLIYLVMGKLKKPIKGTDFIMIPSSDITVKDIEKEVNNILFTNYLKKCEEQDYLYSIYQVNLYDAECNVPRKVTVILPKRGTEETGYLYVGDILVGRNSYAMWNDSPISYNLWYVSLEPNRLRVGDLDSFTATLDTIFRGMPNKFYEEFLNIFTHYRAGVLMFDDIPEFTSFALPNFYEELIKVIKEKYGEDIVYTTKEKLARVQNTLYDLGYDYTILLFNDNLIRYAGYMVEEADRKISELQLKELEEQEGNDYKYEDLPFINSLIHSTAYVTMFGAFYRRYNSRREEIIFPKILINKELHEDTLGEYVNKENIIRLNKRYIMEKADELDVSDNLTIYDRCTKMCTTLFEEVSHAYGMRVIGCNAADLTRCFETAQNEMAINMSKVMIKTPSIPNLATVGFLISVLYDQENIIKNTNKDIEILNSKAYEQYINYVTNTMLSISEYVGVFKNTSQEINRLIDPFPLVTSIIKVSSVVKLTQGRDMPIVMEHDVIHDKDIIVYNLSANQLIKNNEIQKLLKEEYDKAHKKICDNVSKYDKDNLFAIIQLWHDLKKDIFIKITTMDMNCNIIREETIKLLNLDDFKLHLLNREKPDYFNERRYIREKIDYIISTDYEKLTEKKFKVKMIK